MIAIAAMSKNRVIGNGNKLPWPSSQEDFAFFKEQTIGNNLLMGRKTYEGLPIKLKNRIIWVLNSKFTGGDVEGNEGVAFITKIHYIPEDTIVCGGASIYEQFLPRCGYLYLTEFNFEVEGDVVMPEFENLFTKKEKVKDISNGTIYKYSK